MGYPEIADKICIKSDESAQPRVRDTCVDEITKGIGTFVSVRPAEIEKREREKKTFKLSCLLEVTRSYKKFDILVSLRHGEIV